MDWSWRRFLGVQVTKWLFCPRIAVSLLQFGCNELADFSDRARSGHLSVPAGNLAHNDLAPDVRLPGVARRYRCFLACSKEQDVTIEHFRHKFARQTSIVPVDSWHRIDVLVFQV